MKYCAKTDRFDFLLYANHEIPLRLSGIDSWVSHLLRGLNCKPSGVFIFNGRLVLNNLNLLLYIFLCQVCNLKSAESIQSWVIGQRVSNSRIIGVT